MRVVPRPWCNLGLQGDDLVGRLLIAHRQEWQYDRNGLGVVIGREMDRSNNNDRVERIADRIVAPSRVRCLEGSTHGP